MARVIDCIKGLSEEEALEAMKLAESNIYKKSLFKFAKHCLGFKDVNQNTHGGMITALESDRKRKLIVMPRGSLKSTISVVAYAIWRLIKDPNERILIDSEVYTNSANFIHEIKAHMQTDKMMSLFGDFRSTRWTQGEIEIAQRTMKHLKEPSISAGGVSTTRVGQHYSLIIGDDYNSFKNSATQEGRRKVINHYKSNLAILEPTGEYVIVGTRYAADDVIGHIISNEIE